MLKTDIIDRSLPVSINKGHAFSSPSHTLKGTAAPGEFYSFQIAIETDVDISDILLHYSELESGDDSISEDRFFCVNLGGIDYKGCEFTKKLSLKAGCQQILWVSLSVPEDANGIYKGSLTLITDEKETPFSLEINVSGEPAENSGFDEPQKMTWLCWLNSMLALDKTVTGSYSVPFGKDNRIDILGRSVHLSKTGLPLKIKTHFDKNLHVCPDSQTVCDEITFGITLDDGTHEALVYGDTEHGNDIEGEFFSCTGTSDNFTLLTEGRVEFDGYVTYKLKLTANKTVGFSDISIKIPYRKPFDTYIMGLGCEGGYTPESLDFKYSEEKHQNPLWLGGINGGLRCEFKGEDFVEPFVNIYYRHRPYHMPKSFDNGGKGGIKAIKDEFGTTVTAYSGQRTMEKGEELLFDFDLLITPLKELDHKKRFDTRYYHRGDSSNSSVSEAVSVGANYMNIHHAGKFNPYINHPFIKNKELKNIIDEAHSNGIKLKIYYTVREQSDHTSEFQALRSLGDEIFPKPKGEQGSILWNEESLEWFRENIGEDVIPAWKSEMDAAIISDGQSRMCNYYIEGLDWLVKKQDIDGIYIDDVAYDRITIRRARKVLDQKDGCLIDLHSWNHYCDLAGFGNSLNIYMPLLPYIDSVWIGEGFDHDKADEDYWITEIAGLPFGMSGELLTDSRDAQYRGMLFGITTRYPWTGGDPASLWSFISEHGLAESEMIGFWNDESPVKTNDKNVKATVYIGENELSIAVASWADEDKEVSLTVDIDGFSLSNAEIPDIKGFQQGESFTGTVMIEKLGGKIITIKKQGR